MRKGCRCPRYVFAVCVSLFFAYGLAFYAEAQILLPPSQHDSDFDNLSDVDEVRYGSNPYDPDTDTDGYPDGLEVFFGYDPTRENSARLPRRIEVDLTKQRLSYFFGERKIGEMIISSGKWNWPTPTGTFTVQNKYPRAWSRLASLWMPYWMGFAGGRFGIHELPEWPGGRKEGRDHLGKPVSHGCIRLGEEDAKKLYEWTPVGTQLVIYESKK